MSNTNWTRTSGPPIVWRIIDAVEKASDSTTSKVRLSIQDIPEDRYDEALDHMCEYFLAEEVLCKSLNIKEDQTAVADSRLLWNYVLKQGMSIGAFKLNPSGELGELVGMNVLLVPTDDNEKTVDDLMTNPKSSKMKKVFTVLRDTSEKMDVRKVYGVDKYIYAMGLSVKPTFRGQKIGVHLLEVRKDIGKKYRIPMTSTLFMGPSSQIQAERAGFKTVLTVRCAELLDADGHPIFPNVETEVLKLMVKQLL